MTSAAVRRAAVAGAAMMVALAAPAADASPTRIAAENARPGTSAWNVQPPANPAIEGYSSEASVAPGGRFHLHVRAVHPGDRYRVFVYRLGWYGGSGGRLVACIPTCAGDKPARTHEPRALRKRSTGWLAERWRASDVLRVGRHWVSGYYVAQLRATSGPDAGAVGRIPLVVRGAAHDHAAVVVQVPVNTWQAYNDWGGQSLYPPLRGTGKPAVKVSFDRPYAEDVAVPVPYMLELPAVSFLERNGYDVSYVTDTDVDRDPGLLLRHRLVLSIGHDEYWSHAMRSGWDAALRRSTNLAALGANDAYWQVRYDDRRRTLVEYRHAALDPVRDRKLRTVEFRAQSGPHSPECRLFGVMQEHYAQRGAGDVPSDYSVAAQPSDPWLAGTGLTPGQSLPGIVGYEWDSPRPGCFAGQVTTLLAGSAVGVDHRVHEAAAVRAVAHSGARVFASGSLQLAWGFASMPGLAQMMRNALADLTRPAAPRSVGIRVVAGRTTLTVRMRARDPRIRRVAIYRHAGASQFAPGDPGAELVCTTAGAPCHDRPGTGVVRYAAVARDRWAESVPRWSRAVGG